MSHTIIEGVDRLGKGTLIEGLKNASGALACIHYEKPLLLEVYVQQATHMLSGHDEPASSAEVSRLALELYQRDSFALMFNMLSNVGVGLVLDRAHLGEMVYAKRYRGYDGSYVFALETTAGAISVAKDLLILLVASDLSYLEDDGLSFDFNKRQEEQDDFIKAFESSSYHNKMMIDVTLRNGNTGHEGESLHTHAPPDDILTAVLNLRSLNKPQKISFTSTLGTVTATSELIYNS